MIRILTSDGRTPEDGVVDIFRKVSETLEKKSGGAIQSALLQSTRRHFQTIYPGSSHYNPNKVQNGSKSGNEGEIEIDVPGVTRAYHDLNIKPTRANNLTIPIHRSSYGKRARDFSDIFKITKKNGTELLAQNDGGSITFLFVLKDSVFQGRDERLMPSDSVFADNIFARLKSMIYNAKM